MRKILSLITLLWSILFLWVMCFSLWAEFPSTYYVVRESSAFYSVPKKRLTSTLYKEIIPPRKITPVSKESVKYIELYDLLNDSGRESSKKQKKNYKYEFKKVEISSPVNEDPLFFKDHPKKIVYEVKNVRKIYGIDKLGRIWKKVEDVPHKWYMCSLCHKFYSKVYRIGNQWVCKSCWIKAYMEENRREKRYLMRNYP